MEAELSDAVHGEVQCRKPSLGNFSAAGGSALPQTSSKTEKSSSGKCQPLILALKLSHEVLTEADDERNH
jgi:hypothetical protein